MIEDYPLLTPVSNEMARRVKYNKERDVTLHSKRQFIEDGWIVFLYNPLIKDIK